MPLTIDKASDDVAFIFIDLVTDNLKKPEDKDANETAAKAKFDEKIEEITECNFTPAQLKKLCKAIETKIVGYAEMTRDIPDAYNRTSAKPLIKKTELDAIREKLAKDACDYFDSFSKGTIIDLGSKGGAMPSHSRRRRSRSSGRQIKSRRQNKSQKRR